MCSIISVYCNKHNQDTIQKNRHYPSTNELIADVIEILFNIQKRKTLFNFSMALLVCILHE